MILLIDIVGNWVLCLEASGVIHLIIYIIGTVAPNAAISTMPFTPDESYADLNIIVLMIKYVITDMVQQIHLILVILVMNDM